jgi:hypothetical protein
MSVCVLVAGALFGAPSQRTAKSGKPCVSATLKAAAKSSNGDVKIYRTVLVEALHWLKPATRGRKPRADTPAHPGAANATGRGFESGWEPDGDAIQAVTCARDAEIAAGRVGAQLKRLTGWMRTAPQPCPRKPSDSCRQ